MADSARGAQPLWRKLLTMAVDPGLIVRNHLSDTSLLATLAVPGLAFSLFFLQTGLDRARGAGLEPDGVLRFALTGLGFGTVGVALLALVGWMGVRLFGGSVTPSNAVRAFALAYSPTLIYVLGGLLCSLAFGWNTAITFGISGVLWSLNPMTGAIREMVGGRLWPAVMLATLCGVVMLLGWAKAGALL